MEIIGISFDDLYSHAVFQGFYWRPYDHSGGRFQGTDSLSLYLRDRPVGDMDYYIKNRARYIRIVCSDKKPFQGKVAGYPPESQASCGEFYVEASYKSFLLPFVGQFFSPFCKLFYIIIRFL
jgi:hypothetical protein